MRVIALDYLMYQLEPDSLQDPETWYRNLRQNKPDNLFPYLVESAGKVNRAYVLEEIEPDLVQMTIHDVVEPGGSGGCPTTALPFVKPTGSQSPAVGPVLKRSFSREKGAGPTDKILSTTLQAFSQEADAEKPWSPYFRDVVEILASRRLRRPDGIIVDWSGRYRHLLSCAVQEIGPQSQTVFLAVKDRNGQLPGENIQYIRYLSEEVLTGGRYVTGQTPAQANATCALCQATGVATFSNGLKGAGINILNADRAGAFPGIDPGYAWKKYAICAACADLLFIFKYHLLQPGPNGKRPFMSPVAGSPALVIPSFFPMMTADQRQLLWEDIATYIDNFTSDVQAGEEDILYQLKDQANIMNFTIVWADVGQNIENVTGVIAQVMPSRLRELSAFNAEVVGKSHPLFPKDLPKGYVLVPTLNLSVLHALLYRPGSHAKSLNNSAGVQRLQRQVAEAIYHGRPLPRERWDGELLVTAQAYWAEVLAKKDGYRDLLYEWDGKNPGQMSAARWIKRMNWFHFYLSESTIGVLPMASEYFEPALESLAPYFGPESGIDTWDKAYAFLLGILYGKVMQIQAARGVDVSANALTWLKRLTLKGVDLPGLYVRVREKLLAYEAEGKEIRAVLQELGRIAVRLGDNIQLNDVQTSYYLLLGQSMTITVLPSKAKDDKGA